MVAYMKYKRVGNQNLIFKNKTVEISDYLRQPFPRANVAL